MRQSVVVIGNFDGVHRGHQALLRQAQAVAEEAGDARADDVRAGDRADSAETVPVIAVTFWPHPVSVVSPGSEPKLLSDLDQRIELLTRAGASQVRVVPFNPQVAGWSPSEFVERVLLPLQPRTIVVGENFRFGNRASGDVAELRRLGEGQFEVRALSLVQIDHDETCSSLVREELAAGDVAAAARHLGRWPSVTGVVVLGDQRGRTLGFPTANLRVPDQMALPADGVYAGYLTRLDRLDAEPMPAAISVGSNPTFDGVERRVESYVLDRHDLELYGVRIKVEFVARLRGQEKFDSAAALVDQMHRDVQRARQITSEHPQPPSR